ncbi:hypothetical protein CTAYLR_010727 [Chrysophaeum taylorii]|uniref:Sel1 repeat family protein n=1 Tax=Chrysophaeum taylorii TaxID=2483200 RepID=A0AAD7UJP4_9STRA|nr:hypothetical protein CTAYLR_010727 [Chrysophaeum taylorii]
MITRLVAVTALAHRVATETVDIIGREFGLSRATQDVDERQARKVMIEAQQGLSTDALHFSGLLSLYGKGGAKQDLARAAEKRVFRAAAERGHASAQTALGVLLRHGLGISRDDYAAFAWFAAAAKANHVEGMWLLGIMYLEGRATAVDHTLARHWLERAASRDALDAMHWLGVMDEYGLGLAAANYTAAATWYRRAATRGHVSAAYHLGLMHAYGRGCNQDFSRALVLFQQAAAKGSAGAMYYIGLVHLYGHGVLVDYNLARAWLQKSEGANDAAISDQVFDEGDLFAFRW